MLEPADSPATRANPYAPPSAPVADIQSESPVGPCKNVELACKLMWLGLWLSALDGVVQMFYASGSAEVIGTIIGSVIGFGIGYLIVWWFTSKLRAGRNWMRWLITTLNILGWLSVPIFWDFYESFVLPGLKANPLSAVSALVQTVVGLTALALLHTNSARQWFRAHSGEVATT